MENLLTFFSENWGYIAPIILWFAARIIKTQRNYDLVEMIIKFIGDYLIPNRRKNNSHKRGYPSSVNTGKFPVILLLVLPSLCFGQLNGNFKSVRFVNAGSNEGNIPTTVGNGAIYYNEGTQTFRAFQNGTWQDLISGGGGLATASNGLNVVGSDVRLGGALTAPTVINGVGVNGLSLAFLSSFIVNGNTDITLTNSSVGVLELSATNGIRINDTRVGVNQTGATYAADYSTNYTDRSIVDRGFVNTRIGGIPASSEIQNPQPADDLEGIIWSELNQEYVLSTVATSANNGVQLAGGTQVQLGGSLINNTTVRTESQLLRFESGTAGVTNSGNVDITLNSLTTNFDDITFTNNTSLTQTNSAITLITNGITTVSNTDGLSMTDANALLTIQPLAFAMNIISENGDLNLGGDGINITGRSITAGAVATSPITITTGQQTVTGNTGGIALTTGNSTGGASGNIQLATGDASSTAGTIEFEFGNTASRIDFTPVSTTFNTSGNYDILNPSGALTIEPETTLDLITADDPGAGTSGSVTIASGTSVSGNTGNIVIQTGTTSATQGTITIETVILLMPSLPTSSVGLPTGAIWNNAGVLNVIP